MMEVINILIVLSPFLIICLLMVALLKSRKSDTAGAGDAAPARGAAARGAGAVVQPVRRAATARNRARNRMAGGDESEDSDGDQLAAEMPEGKVGKKKLLKLEAKAEKKAQREADERERQERKERQEQEAERTRERERKEEEVEEERLEQERLEREEKERREHEEYLAMKASFGVEEEGFDEQEEENQQNMLQQFIDYIKSVKVVLLEDLAAQFGLKTQDAIDRLQTLMADGSLSGVIDDRGKFICIPMEELQAVAKFIRQRGRVSLAELVENSNSLISLTPEAQCAS